MFRKKFFIAISLVLMLSMLPVAAFAGSNSSGGITLNFPDSYASCDPSDTVSWTGTGGQEVNYFFFLFDRTTNTMIPLGSGSATGDGSVAFLYPSEVGGTMTFVATIQVGNTKISGQWTITCEPPAGGQGCTPGYWKNHLEDWGPTGYSPADIFNDVFGVSYFGASYTLDDAINQGGGGVRRLARHGTAALLNAAHPDVNYPYSVAQVIAWVQAGVADPLAQANELGCSIR
jgi:hypothetical protein